MNNSPHLYSPKEVRKRFGDVSTATLWRKVQRKEIPAPVRVSPGRVGFDADAIDACIRAILTGTAA